MEKEQLFPDWWIEKILESNSQDKDKAIALFQELTSKEIQEIMAMSNLTEEEKNDRKNTYKNALQQIVEEIEWHDA